MEDIWPNAIIMLANYYCSTPGERIEYLKVQSRFFVWCKSGSGTVTINGQAFAILPGMWLLAPWNHHIVYQASSEEPFLLGCIHLIPDWPPDLEPYWEIFHELPRCHGSRFKYEFPDAKSCHLRLRADRPERDWREVCHGWAAAEDPLFLLGEYIVNCFRPRPLTAGIMRHLAQVLLLELRNRRPSASPDNGNGLLPLPLQQMLNSIELMLEEEFSLEPLLANTGCSKATAYRLFRRYLQTTPGKWAMRRKMAHAANLLLSSNLGIGDIADRVGVPDHYYFSKLFRQYIGVNALTYRKNRGKFIA